MKKMIAMVLAVVLTVVSLFGCSVTPKQFSGEWKFAKVSEVELIPSLDDSTFDLLKQEYNAEDEAGIVNNAKDRFVSEQTFANFYLKFESKNTYTYDPFLDREATWVFYQTGENEGFISFYAELDASEGNPDPVICPEIVYKADTNTMYIVLSGYGAFMFTLELKR